MSKAARITSLAAVALLASAPAANAAVAFGVPTQYCLLNGALSSCATFTISSFDLNTVLVNVTNDGGSGTYNLAGFWFFYRDSDGTSNVGKTMTLDNLLSDPTWSNGDGLGASGILAGETIIGGAYQPGTGLAPGSSGSFYFDVTNGPIDWDNIQLAFRGQGYGIDGQGSFLCDVSGGDTEPSSALCEPPTVVPEPATMALLATGLVGMGGATLLRRRRQKQDA